MAIDDDREVETVTNSTPEEQERERLRKEVELGVERCNLTDIDARIHITIINTDPKSVFWRPKLCQTCARPKIVHDPTGTSCKKNLISHSTRIKYEIACKDNEVMSVVAEILAAVLRNDELARNNTTAVPAAAKFDKRIELADWAKDETWESFKLSLEMYDKASEKKPAGKFNDLIGVLKRSGKIDLADPLMQDLMDKSGETNIIKQSINWLAARVGKTPTEEFVTAWRAYRTGLRKKDETIAEYLTRFDNISRKLESHGFEIHKREKAVAMVEMALLSTAECVAVLSIARFEERGDDSNLYERVKTAMRSSAGNILGKESAPESKNATTTNTVLVAEHQEVQPPETEEVYWGEGYGWQGARRQNPPTYKTFQGPGGQGGPRPPFQQQQYQPRPFQPRGPQPQQWRQQGPPQP